MTGSEVTAAVLKSCPIWALAVRSTLAPPASATVRSGWRAWIAATAFSAGTTAVSSLDGLPATLNVTRADWPLTRPALVNGDWTSAAVAGSRLSEATTCWTVCRSSGSRANVWPAERPWTSTASPSGCCTAGSLSIRSARPAWPGS